jgi:hypothetical protein
MNMNGFEMSSSVSRSRGVALILSLLLLLVLTVIGVGTLSTVSMQERMASNANLQTLAFNAASAGVTETLEQWLDEDNWPAGKTCDRGMNEDWSTNWTAPTALVVPGIPAGFAVQYQTRLGCFEANNWELLTGSLDPPPQQLLALSRGRVFQANSGVPVGDPIAEREVEVRLERRGGGLPECLMQFCPLNLGNLTMGKSKIFSIDAGEGGCPIGTSSPADAKAMRGQLRENQVGQYRPTNPGITSNPLRGSWGDPVQLARAVNGVKIGLRAHQQWAALNPESNFGSAVYPDSANAAEFLGYSANSNPFQKCAGTLVQGDSGTCPSGGITYIAGNLGVAGNCVMQGMVIVEGSLTSSGTPAYTGNLLLLGGNIRVNGWGKAPNSGILVAQNLQSVVNAKSPRVAYEPVEDVGQGQCTYDVAGGGTAAIRPLDCADLQKDWKDLNVCLRDLATMTDPDNEVTWAGGPTDMFAHLKAALAAKGLSNLDTPDLRDPDPTDPSKTEWTIEFPVPECAGEPTGGRRNAIASWREFIDQGRWDNVPILN